MLAIVGLVLAGAAYVGSPYLAVASLRSALRDGDRDRLEGLVDFSAVRESLKAQLNTQLTASFQADPEMRDNPFAGFAVMMVPMIVNQAVDVYVTPDGLAALTAGQKPEMVEVPAAGPGSAPAPPTAEDKKKILEGAQLRYAGGLDTFHIVMLTEAGKDAATFVLRRQGPLRWKLTRLQLPADMLDRPKP